jgi:hypothetical protein
MADDRRTVGSLERHVQTILSSVVTIMTSLVLAGLVWGGSTLLDLKTNQAKTDVKVDRVIDDVGKVQGQIDRATTPGVFAAQELEARVRALELRVGYSAERGKR